MPTIINRNTEAPKPSRDTCSITSTAFAGNKPSECHKYFKESVLYTTLKLITASEYRFKH